MLKIIIYENNKKTATKYINIINRFMLNKNINYKIIVFNRFSSDINKFIINKYDEKRIYLLDVEVEGMSGIDLAREIRNNGDWNSQIIILTAYEEKEYYFLTNRLLMLTFILKKHLEKELFLSLEACWKIFFNQKLLTFRYNSEIVNIPYKDICYIEKNLHNNIATIFTKDEEYAIRSSINNLMELLKHDSRFFKAHRSCIINIDNVYEYSIDSNTVKFGSREINLVSRDRKKEFENLLLGRR